ncbi:MAG: thiamine phosphate synthase [Candidatus Omnitrophica bacterium]|nr:thiamine phosphate synthase [Candidatus Omnitrophota bacterium]
MILDTDICAEQVDILELAQEAIAGGCDIIQLRAKNWSARKILEIGQKIKKLVAGKKTLFIINDRADLACALAADGVHLGQDDLPVKAARRMLGQGKIIGLSTHSLEQAQKAEQQGADYLAIGPIFATSTKPKLKPLGLEIISKIKARVKIPFVVIGGINLNNLDKILVQGAERIAICQAIIGNKEVLSTTAEFAQRLRQRAKR